MLQFARPYPFTATNATLIPSTVSGAVVGITFLDTSASANHVTLYEGAATTTVIGSADAAASSSGNADFNSPRAFFGGANIVCTGNCRGTVWVI